MSSFSQLNPNFVLLRSKQLRQMFLQTVDHAKSTVAQGFTGTTIHGAFPFDTSQAGGNIFDFGHQPLGAEKGVCSKTVFYELKYETEANSNDVTSVDIRLYLFNFRIIFAQNNHTPATYFPETSSSGEYYQKLGTASVSPIGLELKHVMKPTASLSDLIPDDIAILDTNIPAGFSSLSDSVRSRFDFRVKWDVNSDFQERIYDAFGKEFFVPEAPVIRHTGVRKSVFNLYTPVLADNFNAMIHKSDHFALGLDGDIGFTLIHELTDSNGNLSATNRRLKREFGLTDDFEGFLLRSLNVHWLKGFESGERLVPLKNRRFFVRDLVVATDGNTTDGMEHEAKWYANFLVSAEDPNGDILGVLQKRASLGVKIKDGNLAYCNLKGAFLRRNDLPDYLKNFQRKQVSISLILYTWKNDLDQEQESWAIELALLGAGDNVIATARNPNSLLLLAPIAGTTESLDADDAPPALDAESRGYYVELANATELLALFAAGSLTDMLGGSDIFPVQTDEMRFTGVYLREQPTIINDDNASINERDIAILFDYDIDYRVGIDEPPLTLETARSVTSSIEGNGIVRRGDNIFWAQVPTGLYELSTADPGLWDLGNVGKLLQVVDVLIRKRNPLELVIRLRLTGNFGVVKADDFVIVLSYENGEPRARVIAYPTAIEVDIKNVIKGKGEVNIEDDGITGTLDLAIGKNGLRLFGGVNIQKLPNSTRNGVLASAEVKFPKPIPICGTGLGLDGVNAIFGMHFVRSEVSNPDGVPQALAWLKSADGDVVRSVTNQNLWETLPDHWSFGVGANLVSQPNPKLLNLNGLLMVDVPGPLISIFTKVNLLKKPKSNEEASEHLLKGCLGVLQFDFDRKEILLAAMTDLELSKLVSIRCTLELFLKMNNLKNWHLYLGTNSRPITAKLNLGNLIKADAELYFMAAGHAITNLDPPGATSLPGFAMAMGFELHARAGGRKLYVEIDINAVLKLSIGHDLYISGYLSISGELNLWVASIGVSAELLFEYLKTNPTPQNQLYVHGKVCGKIKVGFVKFKGCVSLSIGDPIHVDPEIPDLIEAVELMSGTDLILLGSGASGPIDAVIDSAEPAPHNWDPAVKNPIPIDCIPCASMSIPPKNSVSWLSQASARTQFNLSSIVGEYDLKSITLRNQSNQTDFELSQSSSRWWRNGQATEGGQALPVSLAMNTRNPVATANALIDNEGLAASLISPCEKVVASQLGNYRFEERHVGEDGPWVIKGKICRNANLEQFYEDNLPALTVSTKTDRGLYSTYVPLGRVLQIRTRSTRFEALKIHHLPVNPREGLISEFPMEMLSAEGDKLASSDPVRTDSDWIIFDLDAYAHHKPIEILVATSERVDIRTWQSRLKFEVINTLNASPEPGATHIVYPNRVTRIEEYKIPRCPRWSNLVEEFILTRENPEYEDYNYFVIELDLNFDDSSDSVRIRSELINWYLEPQFEHFLLFGGMRAMSAQEIERVEAETEINQSISEDIVDFINGEPIPLLEPDSLYELSFQYDKIANGAVTSDVIQSYRFKTDKHPPRKLAPYLLGTFPMANAAHHYYDDDPGIVLASDHILRVLDKYRAKIKVTITNASGRDVPMRVSTSNQLWNEGVVFEPSSLFFDSLTRPEGLAVMACASMPNALLDAVINESTESLGCIQNIPAPPDTGIWLGFDVQLEALSRYTMRIEIVQENNGNVVPWPFNQPHDGIFHELLFGTSNFASTEHHATEIERTSVRHRRQISGAVFNLTVGTTVSDKIIDDQIFELIHENPHRERFAGKTIIYREHNGALQPKYIYLETNEPLERFAEVPYRGVVDTGEGPSITLADLERKAFVEISENGSVEGIVAGEGGCRLIIVLDDDIQSDVEIQLSDRQLLRIFRNNLSNQPLIKLTQDELAARPIEL